MLVILLQILGFLPLVIYFVKKLYTYISLKSGASNCDHYILRKKDYDIYRSIKYKYGIKSAKMIGSNVYLISMDLIKTVNQDDFNYFPDRHPPSYHSDPTMNKMLSFATGQEWKNLKVVLTQAFATNRIRKIYQDLHKSGTQLVQFIRSHIVQDQDHCELEIVRPINKYLLEIIACSVFGLEDTGIYSSDNKPFEMHTKEIQKAMIRHRQARLIPGLLRLAKLFNLIRPNPNALNFFKEAIENAMNKRQNKDEKKNDMLQLLMEAMSSPTTEDDGVRTKKKNIRIEDDTILSQALMFFFAGTEGPATLLIYGLYELAMNQEVQQKLYDEVCTIADMDYETIINLPYLDVFVSEVLRMYSSSVIARRCSKRYKLPGTEIIIEPGTNVHTPIYGIHHDEEFYPDPFKFNPDNFTTDAKAKRPRGAFSVFGLGPRSCIATKFALVQGKSAICQLVSNFHFETCWRTEAPPKGSLESMYLPINGLWLKVKNRNKGEI